MSEATQKSNGSLGRQTSSVLSAIRAEPNARLAAIVDGHEYGKLSADRPHLREAIEAARRHGAGIVASDLSRLVRSESFDKVSNRLAIPTDEEIAALLAMMDGVAFVATIADPSLSPSELHSRAVRRGMKAKGKTGGRPPSIDFRTASLILNEIGGDYSLREIAKRYGVKRGVVERLAKSLFPSRNG